MKPALDKSPAGSVTGIDLAACPFCGGAAHVETEFRHNRVIECGSCGVNIGAVDLARGIAMWNARATPQHPEALADGSLSVPRNLLARCLSSMKAAVTFGETRQGRPPSQTCLFEIEDLEAVLAGAATPQHSVTEQALIGTLQQIAKIAQDVYPPAGSEYHTIRQLCLNTLDGIAARAHPLASTAATQPEQRNCGQCNGSGWMVRDPDIGTEQECFACDGKGQVEDDTPATAATQPEQASALTLPGCLADRLYEAIGIALDRASRAGSLTRMAKWDATHADLRAALAIPASTAASEQQASVSGKWTIRQAHDMGHVYDADGKRIGYTYYNEAKAFVEAHNASGRATIPSDAASEQQAGVSELPGLDYRTCCDHPDCTTCGGNGGFYRIAALTHRATAARPGYKLVPIIATDDMEDRAQQCDDEFPGATWGRIWSAMLAATPDTAATAADRKSEFLNGLRSTADIVATWPIWKQTMDAPACTCPSGDGSLRWPCPQHPPEATAADQLGDTASASIRRDAQFNAKLMNYGVAIALNDDGREAYEKIVAHLDGRAQQGAAHADECAANMNGHRFGAHGVNGERQCEWCGAAPATSNGSK